MKNNGKMMMVLGALAASVVLGAQGASFAQNSLAIGGSTANFGEHTLQGNFVPDPKSWSVTSGGSLNIQGMSLGANCTGFATRNPDVIVNYTNAQGFLRFYFQGQGDTALVINDPNGNWRCNDDTAGLNPQVDFPNPPSGQYDIWVSSYEAGTNIRGSLFATELRSNSAQP